MAIALGRRRSAPQPLAGRADTTIGHARLVWPVVAGAVALVWLVGHDGSPMWQVIRSATVVVVTAAVLVAFARAPQRQAGDVATALGTTGLVIGVGFAPHLVKTGAGVTSFAAAALTVASLVLMTVGIRLASRGRSRVRRVAAAAPAVLTAAVSVWVLSPAVAATNVPDTDVARTPSAAGLEYRDVRLPAGDGVELAAWWIPSRNGAAVVLLHGAGSTRSNVIDHAAVLAGHGFGVLLVDARGHGESEGRAMDFGWHGDADIAAATRFLVTHASVDPRRIGAVGMSMGGEEAIGATAENRLLRAVVAEGATARSAADEAWLSDVHGWRGVVQEQLERVQDVATDLLTSASPPVGNHAAVRLSSARYLLIAAGDVRNEQDAAAHVASAAPDRVSTWVVPGSGHTDAVRVAPDEWERRVITFLQEALL